MNDQPHAAAVLISGGLDSAILLGETLRHGGQVHPLYIRTGTSWEAAEQEHLHRFLDAIRQPGLKPLQVLDVPVADLYGPHWSITGRGVPGADTPDQAVYLPGRNVLLLSKALLWCHLHGVASVALGILESNPFPDATPAFFATLESAVNQAVAGRVEIRRPFADMTKKQVMALARVLPLALTFSCIRPVGTRHCGRCNKCGERRRAFVEAGLRDDTEYDLARRGPNHKSPPSPPPYSGGRGPG